MSLFEYLERVQAEREHSKGNEGSANIATRLRMAANRSIRDSGLSRHQVAGQMSHFLGIEITKTQIDSWTAESKPLNRMPAEFAPAFCLATGSTEVLEIMNDAAGIFGLPGPDALRAEIQKYGEQERKARSEKRKREIFLREMERGRISNG